VLEVAIGGIILFGYSTAISPILFENGLKFNLWMSVGACLTFTLMSGYLFTSLLLAFKVNQIRKARFVFYSLILYIFHFAFFGFLTGILQGFQFFILLICGCLTVATSVYISDAVLSALSRSGPDVHTN
jgi:hypothetical protein